MKINGITDSSICQEDSLTEWDKAISDAKKGIKRLELAIETCKEMKAKGEPWPGRTPQSDLTTTESSGQS